MFFQGYSVWTYGGTVLGYMGYNAILFTFLRGFASMHPRSRPFLLAGVWALYEYLKSIGFLGYPWGLVAYPSWDILPLIQFIDITGIWGLSLLMALVNSVVAEAAIVAHGWDEAACARRQWLLMRLRPPGRRFSLRHGLLLRQALFAAVMLGLAFCYGAYRLSVPIPAKETVRLLLVQQNIDPWDEGRARSDSTRINQDLTAQGLRKARGPVDLVVWSEISVPDIWVVNGNGFRPRDNSLVRFVRETGVPLLTGQVIAVDPTRYQFMNGAVLLSPGGEILDTYGKMHPVPFAESIPFYEHAAVRWFFKSVIGVWNPWVMGTRQTVFHSPLRSGASLAFGAPICFEDGFADLCRKFILQGADLWLNLTNDYWSKTVFSEVQHFQVAAFRAVENRRVLVRSTNGGVTAVVGPWGELRGSLPLFKRDTLEVDVPVYKEDRLTPYTRFGDYLPKALAVILLAVLLAGLLSGRPGSRGSRRK
jgi:apolipoprotein N-acyltransferase